MSESVKSLTDMFFRKDVEQLLLSVWKEGVEWGKHNNTKRTDPEHLDAHTAYELGCKTRKMLDAIPIAKEGVHEIILNNSDDAKTLARLLLDAGYVVKYVQFNAVKYWR